MQMQHFGLEVIQKTVETPVVGGCQHGLVADELAEHLMLFAVATDGTADDGHVMALFCLHARKYRNHRHRTTAV
jgi:hypothetical protein